MFGVEVADEYMCHILMKQLGHIGLEVLCVSWVIWYTDVMRTYRSPISTSTEVASMDLSLGVIFGLCL